VIGESKAFPIITFLFWLFIALFSIIKRNWV